MRLQSVERIVCACYNFKIVNVFRKEKDCFLYLLILSVTSIIDIYCKMNIDKEQQKYLFIS